MIPGDSTFPPHDAAFPHVMHAAWEEAYHGLSRRDLFAAMAMQGYLANAALSESDYFDPALMAGDWRDCADALIQALGAPDDE